MTITIPMSLGPSWLPKLGGLIAVFTAAFAAVPDNAPGASYVRPWIPFLNAVAVGLVGFSARQVNKTSEQMGLAPQPNPAAVPGSQPAASSSQNAMKAVFYLSAAWYCVSGGHALGEGSSNPGIVIIGISSIICFAIAWFVIESINEGHEL